MIRQLLIDKNNAPKLFAWQGPIPRWEIEKALDQLGASVPEPLMILWEELGGGEMFESEDVLSPTSGYSWSGLVGRNSWFREQGMSDSYLVFHEGTDLTAISQPDLSIVQLDLRTFVEISIYASLDRWYEKAIRSEFWERYGLSPANSRDKGLE